MLAIATAVLALGAAGCGGDDEPEGASSGGGGAASAAGAPEAGTLKLGTQPWIGYGPFTLAEENGAFEEQGLDVEISNFKEDKQINAALASGRLDAVNAGTIQALTFAAAGLQAWAAGFMDGRPIAAHAVSRSVLAAGALAVYPTVMGALVLAVNHLTAAVIRHPAVEDGINAAIGGALVVAAVSGGLSLGLAVGAAAAAVYFLAAIFVMKIALTALLCVLLVSGALVIALWPLPQAEPFAQMWGAGLLAAVLVPVAWALVFAVAGLVASDALVGGALGSGLEDAVKPFVAVARLYLVYQTPGVLVADARAVGVRLDRQSVG